jgi:BASS family bile acid:Na+ symporter
LLFSLSSATIGAGNQGKTQVRGDKVSEIITQVLLPLSLAVIMLSMGLTLSVADFTRLIDQPRDFLVGALLQMGSLPLIALALVYAIPMRPEIAVGLMLIAACPGGTTSTMLTHIGRGDVALSITLTTFTSLMSIVTLPLIMGWSLDAFMGAAAPELPLLRTVASIFVILIAPTALGMAIARYAPRFSAWAEPKTRPLALILFILIVVGALAAEREKIVPYLAEAGPIVLALNLLTMLVAFVVAALFDTGPRQRTAITLECGLQNATLAIVIAITMMRSVDLSIPGAAYGLLMLFTGLAFALWAARQSKTQPAGAAVSV